MATKAIPVLCAGAQEAVGKPIIAGLRPEVDVIHFILLPHIESELPLLLQNQVPASPSSSIGSGDWSTNGPPLAILLGGAYDDATIDRLRKLVYDTPDTGSKARRIPWLRVDAKMKAPDPKTDGPAYRMDVVRRLKEGLVKLQGEGKLNDRDGGVYLF